MNIVGVNISHDTSVCLLQDGKILFYLEEERLLKRKHHCIEYNELDYSIKTLHKIKDYVKHVDYLIISTYRRWPDSRADYVISEKIVNNLLSLGIAVGKVDLILEGHHLHHAYNAFYMSGFESAVAIIMDGSGSYSDRFPYVIKSEAGPSREIESIYEFKNNQSKNLFTHYSTLGARIGQKLDYKMVDGQSMVSNTLGCGSMFLYVSIFLFKLGGNDSGKVMGMSSYGNLDEEKIKWFKKYGEDFLFDCEFLSNARKNKTYADAPLQEKANLAKRLQYETKEYTLHFIQKAINMSECNNVVLSGGYFQNCVNNYEYLKAFPHINFYVDPICYDGGTAIGACLYVWHHILGNPNTLQKFDNLYLGPTYLEEKVNDSV
jgi:carbamoyltransferase